MNIIVEEFTKTGNYHKDRREENQDIIFYKENRQYFFMAIADGATACKNSRIGAKIACKAMGDYLLKEGESLFGFSEKKIASLLLEQIVFRLRRESEEEKKTLESYASTLLFCFVNKKNKQAILFSLGDCALFYTSGGKCSIILPPKTHGGKMTCLTTTKDAYKDAQVLKLNISSIESLFACTDGLYNLMKIETEEARMKRDIADGNYTDLNQYLDEVQVEDDCSYVSCKRAYE